MMSGYLDVPKGDVGKGRVRGSRTVSLDPGRLLEGRDAGDGEKQEERGEGAQGVGRGRQPV